MSHVSFPPSISLSMIHVCDWAEKDMFASVQVFISIDQHSAITPFATFSINYYLHNTCDVTMLLKHVNIQ